MDPNETKPKLNGLSNGAPNTKIAATVTNFFSAHPNIRFVRFQWQDLSGLLRGRIIPLEHALAIAAGERTLRVGPVAFMGVVDNSFLPSTDFKGNDVLVTDWTSLRTRQRLDPLYASVMCKVVQHLPYLTQPNWNLCPRRALETVVEKGKQTLHVDFLVGLEVEFEIMKATDEGGYVPYAKSLEEAVVALMDAGVKIDAFQSEGNRGQYEIALGPLPPVQAVDQLLLVHDTLKHIFARHGLVATMSPRPLPSRRQSSGQHAHISINPPQDEESFLAGMLQRLPQLCAFGLPYEISYERVKPVFAGNMVSWGTEDRTVPIRKVKAGHWEFRSLDATANMYLALAAILSAGILGCVTKEPLVLKDCGIELHSDNKYGETLPQSLDEALNRLETTFEELENVMESRIIRHYLQMKKYEASLVRNMGTQAARDLLIELF
ncbi:glutamine synthetase, catalytic domain-containing protein [Trichoderma breve]|uniref:Glutamine synthetase, catalytic domain-containing protein n=1 Tax=Trichoderma breve TaxID=2034170 RepID=A0A9W9E585_9HYPO|nr:glutamine synthetase, catalytic domain-containing protein [Trichoderma breve]KAJ4857825.1 glutamine synthetase, catalytic domain-containing protein [Trichoderma breve]